MIEKKVNIITSTVDWLQKKSEGNQVSILLLAIIGFLGYYIHNFQTDMRLDIDTLTKKIQKQDSIISVLNEENQLLKFQGILLLDAYKDDPNPRWITDAATHQVKSVNDAYEKKHLRPLGLSKYDLIGTTGEHIFGQVATNRFIENNLLVLKLGIPITFENELNKTLKFPIGKGNYIYAIGGYEYLDHPQ